MIVVGADLSTFAIDLVRLDYDTDRAEWTRHTLPDKPKDKDWKAWERIQAGRTLPLGGTYWDDVVCVGIEQPAGQGDSPRLISIVLGLLLAHIPERIPVMKFEPKEWRKACGLPGNCSKSDVNDFVASFLYQEGIWEFEEPSTEWPQDACDAYAIAYAARAINQTQDAA